MHNTQIFNTFLCIIFCCCILLSCKTESKPKANSSIPPKFVQENPIFKKQGELYFLSAINDTICKLNVQIANNPKTWKKGLMHFEKLNTNCGMLFIFDQEKRQSFWMKNTHIPLDIIFINSDKEIIDIAPNNEPYSLEQITSLEYSLYAVEVNSGYCNKNNIKINDKIEFIFNK